jgi:hypothetical protein
MNNPGAGKAEPMTPVDAAAAETQDRPNRRFNSSDRGHKPKPYSRECLAREIPGATCQSPQCDC